MAEKAKNQKATDKPVKETTEQRRQRIARDPKRGKGEAMFIANGRDNRGDQRSHREKTSARRVKFLVD